MMISTSMLATILLAASTSASTGTPEIASPPAGWILSRPGAFAALTEPPCSYCSTQHRKGLIADEEPVVAWLRGEHNGGAFPIRHFLAGTRVVNDTYGLFFFDPDGGYVSAFKKDYGYRFHGWRNGVMVVEGPDGTLWSALSGRALAGPRKDARLERVPSLTTTWEHWLMLHPESTTYDLFDGNRYSATEMPTGLSPEAQRTMAAIDQRLEPTAPVLGVWTPRESRAYPLAGARSRDCFSDEIGGVALAVFWYGATRTAAAYETTISGRRLTFHADEVSPETAPFKDRETGSRWTVAGRAVDGPLRGQELRPMNFIQCRWFAWVAENPDTSVHQARREP